MNDTMQEPRPDSIWSDNDNTDGELATVCRVEDGAFQPRVLIRWDCGLWAEYDLDDFYEWFTQEDA